ncbi:MAG: hypothetical protein HUJ31_01560 [Pseudomonadales bacterium]|nr:hypothetical protein [Pseudomonadales bacterium]
MQWTAGVVTAMKFRTRLRSTFMRVLASPEYRSFRQGRARIQRKMAGRDAVVHYFHETADPWSHLAVQKLDVLRQRYDLEFRVHLTSPAADVYRGDPARYPHWAIRDAASVAAAYGVDFPGEAASADPAAAADAAAGSAEAASPGQSTP